MTKQYTATSEQQAVIDCSGSAFVTACPGAGKTRTMVERARRALNDTNDLRGVAFLSFTNAAVAELDSRLRSFGALPNPFFPSIICTFDSFLWQTFIAPFGVPGCDTLPKLVVDKDKWEIKPYTNGRPLHLGLFDRKTGAGDVDELAAINFQGSIKAYETAARNRYSESIAKGLIDFEDVREIASARLRDQAFSNKLGKAISGRFKEFIIDEAQDCNKFDLETIKWLRESGIHVKVICDPNQAIYEFRGGITRELDAFQSEFDESQQLQLSGNFRSSPNICSAIVSLREIRHRLTLDQAIGPNASTQLPVYVLSYTGGVTAEISNKFVEILSSNGLDFQQCPILASTNSSACKAAGRSDEVHSEHCSLVLADAVNKYHQAFKGGSLLQSVRSLHRAILKTQGHITFQSNYSRYIAENDISDESWREEVSRLGSQLEYKPGQTITDWISMVRDLLKDGMADGFSISSRLKVVDGLDKILTLSPVNAPASKSIHSAKGLEFPAVCVVLTSRHAKGILDFLIDGVANEMDEQSRKLYVAASRAQQLLVIAIPKSQSKRLKKHLEGHNCEVVALSL